MEALQMKTIAVTIKLELEVPDEWEVVKTSEGVDVISMGEGQYLDLTFEPMVTEDIEGTWTNSLEDGFMNDLLDKVVSEDVAYKVIEPLSH
uniref:Uncharacterized protein n=1 Tax=Dechloromonas aromatica (strain RCB) TaxID=159087 RepID=Q47D39_DECAR